LGRFIHCRGEKFCVLELIYLAPVVHVLLVCLQGRCGGNRFLGGSRGQEWHAARFHCARLYFRGSHCQSYQVCVSQLKFSEKVSLVSQNRFFLKNLTKFLGLINSRSSEFLTDGAGMVDVC
jgi:hypothetical protein